MEKHSITSAQQVPYIYASSLTLNNLFLLFRAFLSLYSCGVCNFSYRFKRLGQIQQAGLRLALPLWPLSIMASLSAIFGFIPVFGPSDTIGMHMLNGFTAMGLLYLLVIVLAFNLQYVRVTLLAASLATEQISRTHLLMTVVARCLLISFFFGFSFFYFFPYSCEA